MLKVIHFYAIKPLVHRNIYIHHTENNLSQKKMNKHTYIFAVDVEGKEGCGERECNFAVGRFVFWNEGTLASIWCWERRVPRLGFSAGGSEAEQRSPALPLICIPRPLRLSRTHTSPGLSSDSWQLSARDKGGGTQTSLASPISIAATLNWMNYI